MIDNIFEYLTISICLEENKCVIVRYICRAPRSSFNISDERMESVYSKIGNKIIFEYGDFNS